MAGLLVLALPAAAQSIPSAARQFSSSQIECSDYFAPRVQRPNTRIIGAREGMLETMFSPGDILYLNGAGGLQPGDQVRLMRVVSLGQQEEQFPGQSGILSWMGAYYVTVGRARILRVGRGQIASARLSFACEPARVGDFAVAWRPLTSPQLPRTVHVNWIAPVRGPAQLLVMGRDHAGILGSGAEVYLTGGAAAGAEVGQAWTIFRRRSSPSNSQFRTASEGLISSTHPEPGLNLGRLRGIPEPADILGRLVIIRVEPRSATAIITAARAPIRAGDEVVPASH